MLKGQKGITLVALVVTIIVLIILAGISISLLVGDNGIISKAKTAGEASQNATNEETKTLSNIEGAVNDIWKQYLDPQS